MLYCLICLSFLNIVLMSFDHYWCVFDRIFPFSKLLEYQRRFRFRKYRTAFGSDEKKYESKNGGVFRRSFPTVFISKRIPKCSSFLILRMCQESWYCSSCLAQVKPNVAKVTCFYKASWFSFQRSHVVEQTFCSPNACSLVMSAAGNSRAPTVVAKVGNSGLWSLAVIFSKSYRIAIATL